MKVTLYMIISEKILKICFMSKYYLENFQPLINGKLNVGAAFEVGAGLSVYW